jgi:Domain of unknown function (DUF4440)
MTSRRQFVCSLGGGLAALPIAAAAAPSRSRADPTPMLIELSEQSNAALMRGDGDTWSRLVHLDERFTLMSPFGGEPSWGAEYTPERVARMGAFFRNGRFAMEMVESYAAEDIVVLALIERAHVEVGGLPAQDWRLRVTLVYRREGDVWRLCHRHADPLVDAVSIRQAAMLARGDRVPETAR